MGDSQLVQEAIRSSKIRFSEAESLFRRMYKETGNLAGSVAKLLPQMKSNAEAKQLVSKATKDDRKLVSQIKQMLGPASKTIFGVPNGTALDLSHEYHRICLSRLFEQNQKANVPRQRQCWLSSGYSATRPSTATGLASAMRSSNGSDRGDAERFTPMPKSGVLEFDFCGGIYPTVDDFAVPDAKFVNVLSNLYMRRRRTRMGRCGSWRVEKELLYDPAKKLKSTATEAQRKKALRPEGKLSVFECSRQRSQEMGLAGDLFYESLEEGTIRCVSRRRGGYQRSLWGRSAPGGGAGTRPPELSPTQRQHHACGEAAEVSCVSIGIASGFPHPISSGQPHSATEEDSIWRCHRRGG